MNGRKIAFVPAMAVAVTVIAGSPALAASHAPAAPRVVYQEIRGINKHYVGTYSGDWTRCNYVTKASYTQSVNCSEGRTVSESISGSASFSAGSVSASIGFNVSYSTTVTAGNSVTIKPGGSGWFDVGFRYQQYTIDMEKRTCVSPGPCGSWSAPQKVTVQNHQGNTFHYFGTGAA